MKVKKEFKGFLKNAPKVNLLSQENEMNITSRNELINKYNEVCKKHLSLNHTLENLSDNELFIYVAGKTLDYGRTWEDSLENAKCSLSIGREHAIRCFSKN